jgi:hypothetical protein
MYKTTKGQLRTLWFFGIAGWIASIVVLANSYYSEINPTVFGLLTFLIPGALIFYTLGWRNYKKTQQIQND